MACFDRSRSKTGVPKMQIGVEISKALENRRVFVIDDDDIIRAAIQFMLHDEFEAHEIPGVTAAVEKAKTQPPDLLIVAGRLVKGDGLSILRVLRETAASAKILIVVEAGENGFGKACVGAGADGYLAKPLRIELVRQKVDAMFGRRTGGVTIPLTVLNVR